MTEIRNQSISAQLLLERGASYEKGVCFALSRRKTILGRATIAFKPDLSFNSLLISRQHCYIEHCEEEWTVSELGSRHGTSLNGNRLEPHRLYSLKNGDKIGLASSVILLRFILASEFEKTLDFDRTQSLHTADSSPKSLSVGSLFIDAEKRVVWVDQEEVSLSVKEWSLLELLYTQQNKLVSYDSIRASVWPERCLLHNGVTDVGADEINVLLHRLRLKLRGYGERLQTRRGQGCILAIR